MAFVIHVMAQQWPRQLAQTYYFYVDTPLMGYLWQ